MGLLQHGYLFTKNASSLLDEIHIHEAKYDKQSRKISYSPKSICSKHDIRENEYEEMPRNHCGKSQCYFNEDEARIYAAELQNSGKEVCGICVSHLYYSGDLW